MNGLEYTDHIPDCPESITPAWLASATCRSGLHGKGEISDVSVEPLGAGKSFLGQVVRLRLTYGSGDQDGPSSIIVKLHSADPNVRTFGSGLGVYVREARFYGEIAGPVGLPVPRCHVALVDPESGRNFLALEDLRPDYATGDCLVGCSPAEAAAALAAIALLHAYWWRRSSELNEFAWLPNNMVDTAAAADAFRNSIQPFVNLIGTGCPTSVSDFARELAGCATTTFRRLTSGVRTMIHGDLRPDNMAFGSAAAARPVVVFDWHTLRRDRPAFDVAWLLLTGLTVENRRAREVDLLSGYHSALQREGVEDYTLEELWQDYRLALVQSIFQLVTAGSVLAITQEQRAWFGPILERFEAVLGDHQLGEIIGD